MSEVGVKKTALDGLDLPGLRNRVAVLDGPSREVDNLLMWWFHPDWPFWIEGFPENLGPGWREMWDAVGDKEAHAATRPPPHLTATTDSRAVLVGLLDALLGKPPA